MNNFNLREKSEEVLLLEYLCLEGLKRIGKDKDERYFRRLKHEFDRIIEKKYQNYFLAVWDFVNWAKSVGIWVGPCRGSAGASLLSYCLGITDIDPIEHDLLFLRFLSEIRIDFPDVDLDFSDERRDEVFSYLEKTYGAEHCAKVATYMRFHPKGVLKDVGRIFDIPGWEINKVSSTVIERCISEDSKVLLENGNEVKIKDLYNLYKERKSAKRKGEIKKEYGISYFIHKKKFHCHAIKDVLYAGKKQMFMIETELGKKIEASEDHKFLTKDGWKRLKDLKETDEIMTFSEQEDYVKCKICGKIQRHVSQDHLNKHNITKAEYTEKFKTKDVCNTLKKQMAWSLGKPYNGKKFFGKDNVMNNKKIKKKWDLKVNHPDRRKTHSEWMKINNPMYNKETASKIMKGFCNVFKNGSKPQRRLYKIIRQNYCGKMRFDFFIKTNRSFRFLDVALIDDKIDFEFDGSFWHERSKNRRDDERRKREIEELGWKAISIKDKDLSKENIIKILGELKCLKK